MNTKAISEGNSSDDLTNIRLCVLGTGGVGKTAFLRRYLTGEFREEYNPTVESTHRDIKRVPRDDCSGGLDNVVLLDVVDTSGQDVFYQDMLTEWILEAEGFILVFSVDWNHSLTDLNMFYNKILEYKGSDVPLIIVANKSDLPMKLNQSLLDMCSSQWSQPIHYVSAKTGENVMKSMHVLLRQIIATKEQKTNFLELWLQIRETFEGFPYNLVDEILQYLFDEPMFRQLKAFSYDDKQKKVVKTKSEPSRPNLRRQSSRVLQTNCSVM